MIADYIPCRYDDDETKRIPREKLQINPPLVNYVLENQCKRFSKCAVRENFNIKPDAQMEKIHAN